MVHFAPLFNRRKRHGGASPQVPPDEQLYAIGDIHGRSDLMRQMLDRIDAELAVQKAPRQHIIFLGDYVDRGPDTRGVLEILTALCDCEDIILLAGNHEEFMLAALEDFTEFSSWIWAGGRETLLSYDINVPLKVRPEDLFVAFNEAREKIPAAHIALLRRLKTHHVAGDYAFVHAGIRPGMPIEQQSKRDLLWIRDEFVAHTGRHSHVIVHGHTPVDEPDVRTNRINIDTGAYITGNLTCLVLEGVNRRFLRTEKPIS